MHAIGGTLPIVVSAGRSIQARKRASDFRPETKLRDETRCYGGSRSPIKIRGKSAATRIPGIQRLQRPNLKFENFGTRGEFLDLKIEKDREKSLER